MDEIDYFISFEWFYDIGDFFSGFFDNIGEFSTMGLIYGFIMILLVFALRKFVFVGINNFILKIVFYFIAFVMGYLSGRKIFE